MHLKGVAPLLTVILLASTHVQALQYSYQPGRRLLQCTTQAACIARCPAGNSPIYLAPQGGASGQCVCICQPTQNSPNVQNSPTPQQNSNLGTQQDSSSGVQQDSASLQNSPVRSGGLINANVGGSGGGSGSSNFGTLGSGLSGGSSTGTSGYGSGGVTSTAGGGDYPSQASSQGSGSAMSALVGAVTSTSSSGSVSSSSTSAGSGSSSGSSSRTGTVGAVGSGR